MKIKILILILPSFLFGSVDFYIYKNKVFCDTNENNIISLVKSVKFKNINKIKNINIKDLK